MTATSLKRITANLFALDLFTLTVLRYGSWGELCACIFYGTEKREKEKDSRYIQEASAPAAVTVYQICNMSPAHVHQ